MLLRLHFRILYRQATAHRARAVVTGLLLVLGTVASLMLAGTIVFSLWVGARRGYDPPRVVEAVHLGFASVYLLVALAPVLGFRASEFFDVTKLFTLPVSHRPVFAAMAVGLSLSGAVLFWLPPLLAGALGLPGLTPLGAAARVGLVLALLLHAVALGQFLVLLLLDFLRSRRFRDLLLVAAPLLAGGLYLGLRWLTAGGLSDAGAREFLAQGWSRWLVFLPSRWVTEAIGATVPGGGGFRAWLPFLLGFVPLTVLLFRAASALQARAFLGDVPSRESALARPGRRPPGARLLARFLPDPVIAMAGKEARTLLREPLVKTLLVNQAVFLLIPFLFLVMRPGRAPDVPDRIFTLVLAALPFLLVFVESTLAFNLFGIDGPGTAHFLTTPVSWRHVLLGKDLCYLGVFGLGNVAVAAALLHGVAAFRPGLVPDPWHATAMAALGGTLGLAVVLAVGNVLSLYLPTPLVGRGRGALSQQRALREGCLEQILRTLAFAGTAVLVAPIPFLLQILPTVASGFDGPWWPPVATALATAYAAALLALSLTVAEGLARERQSVLLERMVRSED